MSENNNQSLGDLFPDLGPEVPIISVENIASTTLQNIKDFMNHKPLENEVKA